MASNEKEVATINKSTTIHSAGTDVAIIIIIMIIIMIMIPPERIYHAATISALEYHDNFLSG